MTVTVAPTPSLVVANAFPYDQWHDRYQEYYQTGLKLYLQSRGLDLNFLSRAHFPAFLRVLRRVRDASTFRRVLRSQAGAIGEYLVGGTAYWSATHAIRLTGGRISILVGRSARCQSLH